MIGDLLHSPPAVICCHYDEAITPVVQGGIDGALTELLGVRCRRFSRARLTATFEGVPGFTAMVIWR